MIYDSAPFGQNPRKDILPARWKRLYLDPGDGQDEKKQETLALAYELDTRKFIESTVLASYIGKFAYHVVKNTTNE